MSGESSTMIDRRPIILRIANAQGFWGDSPTAAADLAAQSPTLDYITLDYLAEVSMSILAKQRDRDPGLGYARDFLDVVQSLITVWKTGRRLRIVTNAGGLNPRACANACLDLLRKSNCPPLKIGIVTGDDVLPNLRAAHAAGKETAEFSHLETHAQLDTVIARLTTANAYLGAAPLVEALNAGADILITGRVADPSLTVAPCISHFKWNLNDYNKIAGATVAGHLIECGTQVTGGISTDWLTIDNANIGFPIVEVEADGSCVVTKPDHTGGEVTARTVKEQLLYELGDPANYLSPDATVSFLTLQVNEQGQNRVRASNSTGRAPPPTYKVSATYRTGYRAAGTLTIVGQNAVAKARRCGEIIRDRLRAASAEPAQFIVECLGSGDATAGVAGRRDDLFETVLRIAVSDPDKSIVERFTREMTPLITSGPQGTTGYAEGRPAVREVFGYWPTLIPREQVHPTVELLEM